MQETRLVTAAARRAADVAGSDELFKIGGVLFHADAAMHDALSGV